MSMTVEQVLAETRGWPAEQIEQLLEQFLVSNYRLPDPKVDAAWAAEIKRRIDDIESEVNKMKMPLAYAEQFYVLRDHIKFVGDRYRQRMAGSETQTSV